MIHVVCTIEIGKLAVLLLSPPYVPLKRVLQSPFGGDRSRGNPIGLKTEGHAKITMQLQN